jgi:hypothetical protein
MVSKLTLGGGIALLFTITVLILTRVLPGPHRATDYLVMGTLATFFCLALLVVVFFASGNKRSDMFYKRRR